MFILLMWRTWLISAFLTAAIAVPMRFLPKHKKLILKIASFVPLAILMLRLVGRMIEYDRVDFILKGLPLHICGLSAILIPAAVLTKGRVSDILHNFIYFVSMPGTIFATLLDPTSQNPISIEMLGFVVPHIMYVILPVLFIVYKESKPDYKMLRYVLPTLIGVAALMHGINLLTAAIVDVDSGMPATNFFFTRFPGEDFGTHYEYWDTYPILSDIWKFMGGDISTAPLLDQFGNAVLDDKGEVILKVVGPVKGPQYIYLIGILPIMAIVWALLSGHMIYFDLKKYKTKKASVTIKTDNTDKDESTTEIIIAEAE